MVVSLVSKLGIIEPSTNNSDCSRLVLKINSAFVVPRQIFDLLIRSQRSDFAKFVFLKLQWVDCHW